MYLLLGLLCYLKLDVGGVVQAAPIVDSALSVPSREIYQPVDGTSFQARGPDPKRKKNKDDTNVIDIVQIQVTETEQKGEQDLAILIKETIIEEKDTNKKKDKKRKDAYKNQDQSKNTVIQVVQVIIDIRQGAGNAKTRYAQHKVTADNGMKDSRTVQVTDPSTMTVSANATAGVGAAAASGAAVSNATVVGAAVAPGGNNGTVSNATAVASAAASGGASAVATGVPAMQMMDPNAPFNFGNATMLMPAGAPAPTWSDVQPDPAATMATTAEAGGDAVASATASQA